MFEWMPVMSGAVLGLLQLRAHIGQRTLLCLAVLIACITTASSGELRSDPQLILLDLALVAAGVFTIRIVAAHPRAARSLRPVHTSPPSVMRKAAARHAARAARAARSARAAETARVALLRTTHRNDPAP
jgi:hypothetical protein